MILADDLRKAVLQAALQGKLTQQLADDSNVDELLKQIKEEKELLAERKNARRDKDFGEIEDTEIEFDIPASWRWIRVGDIGVYKKGPFGSSLTKSMFVPKGSNAVKVYEQKNAIQKDASLGEYYITRQYYDEKMSGFRVESGDIIVSCAGTIGETYVMPENIELGIINQALMRMNIVESINLDYFLYYFDHVLKSNAKKSSNGSAIKNIPPFDVFKKMLFPVPPIEEQQRIVEKLNHILSEIDGYASAEQELNELQYAFPDDMRKSILQYAMQGKLVEQRLEEGTGDDLYQQIQAEKDVLIKMGKIKKEKPLPELTDDEIPFDIPENWKWVRLGELLTVISDGTHKTPNYVGRGVPFLSVQNISSGSLDMTKAKYISEEEHEQLIKRVKPKKNDILICRIGTLGKAIKVTWDFEFSIFVSLGLLRPVNPSITDYLIRCINSPVGTEWILENRIGGGTHTFKINLRDVPKMLIPLPPIAEQHRIIEKLDRIIPHIEDLKEAQ